MKDVTRFRQMCLEANCHFQGVQPGYGGLEPLLLFSRSPLDTTCALKVSIASVGMIKVKLAAKPVCTLAYRERTA